MHTLVCDDIMLENKTFAFSNKKKKYKIYCSQLFGHHNVLTLKTIKELLRVVKNDLVLLVYYVVYI